MILPLWFKILLCIFLFFLGASVYSFLNVVIFRVPRGEEFVKTRSHCPGCGKLLSPLELVPVVSYVCLGGKCKNCGSKIGCRDVLIEVFGGLSAIASFALFFMIPAGSKAEAFLGEYYGRILAGLTVFAFIGALTVITFIQNDMGVVKSGTVIALAVITLIGYFTLPEMELTDRLVGAASMGIVMMIFAMLLKKLVPLGLVWVAALSGFLFGWGKMLVVALPAGIVFGILELLFLFIFGKKPIGRHIKIVFALSVGILAAVFTGDAILKLCGIA